MSVSAELASKVYELELRLTTIESGLAVKVDSIQRDMDEMKDSVDELHEDFKDQRLRESSFWENKWVEVTECRADVNAVQKSVDSLTEYVKENSLVVPPWESEHGRRVIRWVLIAMVAMSMAIGGGLTAKDVIDLRSAVPIVEEVATP